MTRSHRTLLLQVRLGTSRERREVLLEDWYRSQLKAAPLAPVAKWEPLLGVRVFVRRVKTRRGSCTPLSTSIRLNTLAKKPDRLLPHWVQYRDQLNQPPMRHEQWRV